MDAQTSRHQSPAGWAFLQDALSAENSPEAGLGPLWALTRGNEKAAAPFPIEGP